MNILFTIIIIIIIIIISHLIILQPPVILIGRRSILTLTLTLGPVLVERESFPHRLQEELPRPGRVPDEPGEKWEGVEKVGVRVGVREKVRVREGCRVRGRVRVREGWVKS